MRHLVDGRKLGRTSAHRKALFANMCTSLIKWNKIETTLPKAKELRSYADRLVTMAKDGSLHARRRAIALIKDKPVVHKLFDELAKRFAARNGGYTRILKLGHRHGDAAPMAIIEYIDGGEHAEGHKDEKKGKPKSEKKAAKPARSAKRKLETKVAKPRASVGMKGAAKRSQPTRKATRSSD